VDLHPDQHAEIFYRSLDHGGSIRIVSLGFYDRHILPRVLDFAMKRSSLAEQRDWVMERVKGEVLEVGFGTGLNLPYYPVQVRTLTAVEPHAGMRNRALKRIKASGRTVSLIARGMQKKQFLSDGSFDTIVSTWTMCSIPDPAAALKEIYRLLKPGGKFVFVEHGLAPDREVAQSQKRFTRFTQKWGGGCHLDRDIEAILRGSKLEIDKLEKFYLTSGLRAGAYTYRGIAVHEKPGELRIRDTPLK
jgi:ubiquinone/menaquinone biosynthesis C-methylase UbiE